jgi:hypothetical protein
MSKKRDSDERVAEPVAVAEAPAEAPLAEYPKMLYIGARRQQVTVNNADEEAQWLASKETR